MKVSKMIVLSSYSLSIYISNSTSMSFITKQQVLAPSLVLYSFAAWTQLTIRRSGNPRHSRSSELQSSSLLEFFCPQNYLYPLPKLPPSPMSDLPTLCSFLYLLFYSLHCPKLSLLPFRLLILPPQRSVASSRSFSKTFSADQIWSRIRRFSTLI
jgi:hypothetical protein